MGQIKPAPQQGFYFQLLLSRLLSRMRETVASSQGPQGLLVNHAVYNRTGVANLFKLVCQKYIFLL